MVRTFSTYYSSNKKKRGRPKKEDDIYQDKWAPTPNEMRLAEGSVFNSQAQSLVLKGRTKPQHVVVDENEPNIRRKIIYATPLPNPRIRDTTKPKKYATPLPNPRIREPKKKAVLYAKPIIHSPPSPKQVTTKKGKKTQSKPNRLWSTLDYYYSNYTTSKEESKLEEESKNKGTISTPPRSNPFAEEEEEEPKSTPVRRKDPFAEDEKVDAPYDEEANSIASSINSITATSEKPPVEKKNKKKEERPPRKSLFSRFGTQSIQSTPEPTCSTCLASVPPPPRKSLVESITEEETVTSGPVSLDEYVPVTQIKVNSDEPTSFGGRPGLGGRLRNSLFQRSSSVANQVQKKREEWRTKNHETAEPPEEERQRQKPKAKLFTEISTDENALHQRQQRIQVDANMSSTIMMTLDDTNTFSSPMKPSPINSRNKSEGGEANEVVEVMDLTTMSMEDFQLSFLENSNACLMDVYEIDYPVHKSLVSGTLSIALPQDVFLLVSTQLSLLDEYLVRNKLTKTPQGDRLLVDSILAILKNISAKQTEYRDSFLEDSFEGCIAAANSFMWMVEKVEGFMELVATKYPHLSWSDTDPVTWMPCQEAKELSSQFSQDAVLAASAEAVCFIMDEVHDAGLSSLLFTPQWEEELVHNEVSVSMTKILERRISVTSNWLEQDFLFHKFVGALVRATICFYMEGIVHKAERLRSARRTLGKKAARKKVAFRNPRKACGRLSDDIAVLQDYFEDIAEKSIALARVISKEFSFLSLLVECMLQAGKSECAVVEIAEFVYAMHKETGANFEVTKFFMSDVWLLMGPKGEHHRVEASIDQMHEELRVFTVEDLETVAMANVDMNGFKLHEVMFSLYHDRIKRERTYIAIAEGAIKQTRRDIKKELKNTELRVQYFLEDLHEEFSALNGSRPRQGEF